MAKLQELGNKVTVNDEDLMLIQGSVDNVDKNIKASDVKSYITDNFDGSVEGVNVSVDAPNTNITSDNTEDALVELDSLYKDSVQAEVLKGAGSYGIYTQWNEPICISRVEDGIKYTYTGVVDKDGKQAIVRFNHSSGKRERKVVADKYSPDDHNAPAITFYPTGEFFIAATGHGQDNVTQYDIFNTWEDVGTLTQSYTWTGNTDGLSTYTQLFYLHGRMFVFSRVDSRRWRYICSDDMFENVLGEHELIYSGTEGLYMLGRKLERHRTASGGSDVIRIVTCGNGSTSDDRVIRRGLITFDGTHFRFNYGSTSKIMSAPYGKLTTGSHEGSTEITELTDVYVPPTGKRFRLWDLSESEDDIMTLISEYDEDAPYGNAKNYLLIGAESSSVDKIEVPIEVGPSLDHPTYFNGMCFARPYSPDAQSTERLEIYSTQATDGYDSDWQLVYLKRRGPQWSKHIVETTPLSEGRLYRPMGSKNGLCDVVTTKITDYGLNPVAYTGFDGTIQIFNGFSKTSQAIALPMEEETYSRAIFTRNNASDQVIPATTWTPLEFNEVYLDTDPSFEINAGSNTITVPKGVYIFHASASLRHDETQPADTILTGAVRVVPPNQEFLSVKGVASRDRSDTATQGILTVNPSVGGSFKVDSDTDIQLQAYTTEQTKIESATSEYFAISLALTKIG